jgi:Adenylate cyclase, family 3 (some proteins contain HAMP domain)
MPDHPARAPLSHLRHDLRTPINQILGYSELLLEETQEAAARSQPLSPDDLAPDLQKIRQAAKTLLNLINENLTDDRLTLVGEIVHRGPENATLFPFAAAAPLGETPSPPAPEPAPPPAAPSTPPPRSAADDSPASVAALLAESASPEIASRPAAIAGRILIVDDQAPNRELLSRQLERQGHSVTTAADGRAALERLRAEDFDLVLLDQMMPVLDGFSTLVELKRDPALRDLPVIMISALDELAAVVRCIEHGAEDFLPKPFNPTLLRARIGAGLQKKRFRDRERAYLAEIETERAKSDRLLLNVLPAPVSERLKRGEEHIVDTIPAATVLFADIVGFTRTAATLPAPELVSRLNDLFSEFDKSAAALGLEKIKTIGDAYMVAGGVPLPDPDHATRCADLALAMLAHVDDLNARHRLDWRIRVGLHSGPLVAGVIGTQKFAYDVWGDTVNIASRLESHGHPGEIRVSAATRQLLEPDFEFGPCGELELKNRGSFPVHRLLRRRANPR